MVSCGGEVIGIGLGSWEKSKLDDYICGKKKNPLVSYMDLIGRKKIRDFLRNCIPLPGCCNKGLQIGMFTQQKCIASQFWRLRGPAYRCSQGCFHPRATREGPASGSSSRLAEGRLHLYTGFSCVWIDLQFPLLQGRRPFGTRARLNDLGFTRRDLGSKQAHALWCLCFRTSTYKFGVSLFNP